MARKIAFEKDKVIEDALRLFQQKGYEATSIRDLVNHLGVSSSSLYSTFGDKDAIFMLALERHSQIELQGIKQQLTAAAAPRTIIENLFDTLIEQLVHEGFPSGSLTLKAATELSLRKPAVTAFLGRYFDALTALFTAFLNEAAARGELILAQPTGDVARYLLFALFNLNLMIAVYPERAKLEGYKRVVLAVLDS